MTIFSDDELSIIENMMLFKPHKVIADMLEKPVDDIGKLVESLCASRELESYQSRLKKRVAITKKTRVKKPAQQEDIILRIKAKGREQEKQKGMLLESQRLKRKEMLNAPKFKTPDVDYSKKHTVRIDSKTFIYINPGEDEEQAKKNFLKIYSRSFKKDEEHIVEKEVITKICIRCKKDKPVKEFNKENRERNGRNKICNACREELEELARRQKKYNK